MATAIDPAVAERQAGELRPHAHANLQLLHRQRAPGGGDPGAGDEARQRHRRAERIGCGDEIVGA